MSELALKNPPPQRPKGTRFQKPAPISQIVAIQQMLMADILNPETPARERAQCARAWTECEERKRILRMKPKPRDIDTEKLAERKLRLAKPATIFLDAIESKPKRALSDKPIDVVTDQQPTEPSANVSGDSSIDSQ